MTFCMITTFYGPHSFGGDAAFVDRLCRALARREHRVHVIYCKDSFDLARGSQPPRPHTTPDGVSVHQLTSGVGALSPLATHQSGLPLFKLAAIRKLIAEIRPDVVHFHNLSLIGGPGLLREDFGSAVKLMTAHEHWLVCPLHVLWRHDQTLCEQPACVSCCVRARKPPQFWRSTNLMDRSLRELDALICPSRSTQREHARRGVTVPTTLLPYFLPEDYTGTKPAPTPPHARPYVAVVGRLEKIKGFQDAIAAMRELPELDLRVAGAGEFEPELRALARGLSNVHFEGRLDSTQVAALVRGARAVVVPSLVYETFGYVVLEAFAEATPAIVRNLGALPELIEQSGGGLTFETIPDLVATLRRLANEPALRDRLGQNGLRARRTIWSEEVHMGNYFNLIHRFRRRSPGRRFQVELLTDLPTAAGGNVTPPELGEQPRAIPA